MNKDMLKGMIYMIGIFLVIGFVVGNAYTVIIDVNNDVMNKLEAESIVKNQDVTRILSDKFNTQLEKEYQPKTYLMKLCSDVYMSQDKNRVNEAIQCLNK